MMRDQEYISRLALLLCWQPNSWKQMKVYLLKYVLDADNTDLYHLTLDLFCWMLLIYKIVTKDLDRFCIFPPNVDKTYLLHFISVNLTFSIWLIQRSYLSPRWCHCPHAGTRGGWDLLVCVGEMSWAAGCGVRDPGQLWLFWKVGQN